MFFACFAAALAGVSPSPYWLDSSEFAAASFEMGVAHPPGHPLALLVGKLFALVPLGAVAFRVGVASALASAAAAAATALLAREVALRVGASLGRRDPRVAIVAGAGAGLAFGLGHAAQLQAVRPEVYALNAALLVTAAFLMARFDRPPDAPPDASPPDASPPDAAPPRTASSPPSALLAAALLLGLALANHHFLAALFCVAGLAFLAARRGAPGARVTPRAAGWVVAAGALGLLVYAWLPLRAAHHPEANWGAPTDPARFFWTVSARAFQKSLGRTASGGVVDAAAALGLEVGILAPLALIGLYLLARLRATRALAVLLGGGSALVGLAPTLVGFDADNPDAYGYLEAAVALLCAASAAAPAAVAALAPRGRGVVLAGAGLVAIAAVAVSARAVPAASLARFADTERFASRLLDEAPPRAAVFSSYFQTVFALWYARAVEARRPDVDHAHRHFLAYPGYRDEIVHRSPRLAPLLGARDLEPAAVVAAARRRPVRLEFDLDLPPPLLPHLRPGALLDAVDPPPPQPPFAAIDAARDALHRDLDAREPQTRRLLFWLDFLDAHLACQQGRPDQAAPAVARARALLDGAADPDLEGLASRCRL